MDLSSVDSAMEVLGNVEWDLSPHAMDQIWALFLDLKFLRTFFLYSVWFNDADKGASLGSLPSRVEAVLTKAAADLSATYGKAYESRAEHWGPEISKLQQKIQLFRPEIENGYYLLSNQTLTQAHSCTMDYRLLNRLVDSIMEQVVAVDHHKANLIFPVKAEIKALKGKLGQLAYMYSLLEKWCGEHHKFKDFSIHLQAVILRAAHLSYVCWIRKMDGDGRQVMALLCDLKKKIKPNIPEIIDMYLEVLKALKNSSSSEIMKDGVASFLDFLLYAGDHKENLFDGLKSLVTFFISALEECSGDAELILRDIKVVIKVAASLHYSFFVDEEIEVLNKLLEGVFLVNLLRKIKLINAEVSLIALKKRETSLMLPVQGKMTTLQKGLRFLTTFSMDPPQQGTGHNRDTWTHIEAMATKAASICHSIQISETKELMVQEIILELAGLLLEILKSNASFVVSLNDKIESLQGEMRSLRLFLTGAPEDYEEKAKPVLASSEAMARKATSLVYWLYENRRKDVVDLEMDILLSGCLEEIKLVNGQVRKLYTEFRKSWFEHAVTFTDEVEFFDLLLGNMKELLTSDADYIASVKPQIKILQQKLRFFRSFLKNIRGTRNKELKDLRKSIMEVANETENVINTFFAKRRIVWYCAIWLSDGIEVIEDINMKARKIFGKKSRLDEMVDLKDEEEVITNLVTRDSIREDEEEVIRDQLFGGSLERNIISIVGMSGLGKSILANKIYNDPQVEDLFLHAWSCVSQKSRREILLDILSNICELPNNIVAMTEDDLCEELNKCLKGERYLVVLDDLLSISAWYSIRQAFPDDQNGSRVLITTRLHSVALRAKRGTDPLPLRLLSYDECSWLFKKTFDHCLVTPKIVNSCKGLPLAVVAINGLLKKINSDQLCHVTNCISSPDDDPQKHLLKILEVSYDHLPNHLKPCFLYFGAFLEDKDIAVWKLINLWIAEGLVNENGCESLEDVAKEYLLDLIDRGLIMIAKRRSNGQVKTCRLHDMVRILCLAKAKNEKFFHLTPSYTEQFSSSTSKGGLDYGVDSEHSGTSTSTIRPRCRLCVHSETKHFIRSRPSGALIDSLLCFEANEMVLRRHSDISFIFHNFKDLSVLDLECINMLDGFPVEIGLLVQLRYLAIKGDINAVPSSIANLSKLETFLLKGSRGKVVLPSSLWRVATLRHVYVDGHFAFTEGGDSLVLCNLVTLATPVLSYRSERILRWYAASIRKLRCIFEESQDYSWQSNPFPTFYFLTNLETLKILYMGRIHRSFRFDFPLNLTGLTLSGFRLPWDEVSAIGRLPYLEVLKLLSQAFEGYTWVMTEHEFLRLKFLKLDGLDIRQWDASMHCFPSLQRLILQDCKLLGEVPSSFGDISTLEMIEVKSCSPLVVESVMKIREAQRRRGNKEFKILTRKDWYCSSSF